jgi:hypothetical protein
MILLRKNIARHIRDQHTSKGRSRCPVCAKTYKTTEWLKDHMRRGHGLGKEETEQIIRDSKEEIIGGGGGGDEDEDDDDGETEEDSH